MWCIAYLSRWIIVISLLQYTCLVRTTPPMVVIEQTGFTTISSSFGTHPSDRTHGESARFDTILCLGIIMIQFIYYSHGISRLLKMYWQSHHLSLKLSKQIKTSVNNWKTYAVWIIKSPRQNWRQINIIGVLGAHKYRGMQGKMVNSKWPNIIKGLIGSYYKASPLHYKENPLLIIIRMLEHMHLGKKT